MRYVECSLTEVFIKEANIQVICNKEDVNIAAKLIVNIMIYNWWSTSGIYTFDGYKYITIMFKYYKVYLTLLLPLLSVFSLTAQTISFNDSWGRDKFNLKTGSANATKKVILHWFMVKSFVFSPRPWPQHPACSPWEGSDRNICGCMRSKGCMIYWNQ